MSFRWSKASTCPKTASSPSLIGRDGVDTGGVADHGTFAPGGPVTWETLISPREEHRCYGDPAIKSPTITRYGCTRGSAKNNHPATR
jgi:hypothetical protein